MRVWGLGLLIVATAEAFSLKPMGLGLKTSSLSSSLSSCSSAVCHLAPKGVRPSVGALGLRANAESGPEVQDPKSDKSGSENKSLLKDKLAAQAAVVSAEDEKKGEVGLSQFAEGAGTRTLGREADKTQMGTVYADMSNAKLSYPSLLLDRFLDGLEDTITSKPQGTSATGSPTAAGARTGTKEKVVVLGTGWGAHALVKQMDASKYDAMVISPRNFFVFTPMLAGAATGTVELRSITESIREVNPGFDYLEATATEIDPIRKKVQCQSVVCEGAECSIDDFEVDYDKLVISIGASVNTFGIPGVRENCYFLKQISDADALRKAIGNTFERANLPGMSDEERIKTLTFVVVGAGPTGVEFSAELRDFIEQDVPRFYPHLLPFIRIKILEASDRVLMQFESSMQARAVQDLTNAPTVEGLQKDYVQVLLKSAVKEVTNSEVSLGDGTVIPYGIAVWAAGIGPMPLTLDLIKKLGEAQEDPGARGRLVIDRWLRVQGTEDIFALGDCTFIPQSPYPATAQVASQQGAYLGRLLTKGFNFEETVPVRTGEPVNAIDGARSRKFAKPFQFLNLGILAYTGNDQALAQVAIGEGNIEGSGRLGWWTWRSAYLSKQVSRRNQAMVLFDWIKTAIFGRDLARF